MDRNKLFDIMLTFGSENFKIFQYCEKILHLLKDKSNTKKAQQKHEFIEIICVGVTR